MGSSGINARVHGVIDVLSVQIYFVLLMKSHLLSYPCPLQINFLWNFGFLLGVGIMLQIISGMFLALHYSSSLTCAYFSLFFIIREVFFGWCLRYFHASGASFVFLFLMAIAFMGYVLPFGQMSFWGATVITNLLS